MLVVVVVRFCWLVGWLAGWLAGWVVVGSCVRGFVGWGLGGWGVGLLGVAGLQGYRLGDWGWGWVRSLGCCRRRGHRPRCHEGWQYIDPKNQIQGPFSLLEMQQWSAL